MIEHVDNINVNSFVFFAIYCESIIGLHSNTSVEKMRYVCMETVLNAKESIYYMQKYIALFH